MAFTNVLSQYTKLAGQFSNNQSFGLLGMAKGLIGNEMTSLLIQKFLSNLSPSIIQKLSVLKALGHNETYQLDTSENFISLFNSLLETFVNQDIDLQVSELALPDSVDFIISAIDMATSLGIDIDSFI